MQTITTTVYNFDELSKESQGKAIDNLRHVNVKHDWWDYIYDDVRMLADLLGINIDKIYFSGFYCQGDGACFDSSYSYRKGWKRLLTQSIGGDDLSELTAIGETLQTIQRRNGYSLVAETTQRGHYMHSNCMSVVVHGVDELQLTETLRRFADWIYKKLEKEYSYLTSDSAVIETIEDNEYLFNEDGQLHCLTSC